jgi:co-chaperonin GroES (HSP10)
MQIVPAKDAIVLTKQDDVTEQVTAGGIVMPQGHKQANSDKVATVHIVGSEVKSVKVGDTVAFSHYGVNVVALEGKPYVFCKEENILGIIK